MGYLHMHVIARESDGRSCSNRRPEVRSTWGRCHRFTYLSGRTPRPEVRGSRDMARRTADDRCNFTPSLRNINGNGLWSFDAVGSMPRCWEGVRMVTPDIDTKYEVHRASVRQLPTTYGDFTCYGR